MFAEVLLEGMPSNTMTLSARYVAMMKSCSTTNAVFFAWRMYLCACDKTRVLTPLNSTTAVCEEWSEGRRRESTS